jgi:hypothetical protein
MIASRRNCSINGAALERALELEKKLPAEGPTFVKGMMHSQVVKGFWLVSLDLLGVLMFVQCQRIRFFMLMRFSFPFLKIDFCVPLAGHPSYFLQRPSAKA